MILENLIQLIITSKNVIVLIGMLKNMVCILKMCVWKNTMWSLLAVKMYFGKYTNYTLHHCTYS